MSSHKGTLVIIGGAEDKYQQPEILEGVVSLIGGHAARLGIITTATEHPKESGHTYREVFSRLGVKETEILDIRSREDANAEENIRIMRDMDGFFFTGGDQLRITSILGGTRVYKELYYAFTHGAAVIGTSAGASVMCSTMIVEGNSNDAARKCTLKMAPGLGLVEGVIIDQHFDQRGRLGRLLCGVAENPGILGIGIDENTAIRVDPEDYFEVFGDNAVTVIDGRSIRKTNVSELEPDEILTITDACIHVLAKGHGYDLKAREVITLH